MHALLFFVVASSRQGLEHGRRFLSASKVLVVTRECAAYEWWKKFFLFGLRMFFSLFTCSSWKRDGFRHTLSAAGTLGLLPDL